METNVDGSKINARTALIHLISSVHVGYETGLAWFSINSGALQNLSDIGVDEFSKNPWFIAVDARKQCGVGRVGGHQILLCHRRVNGWSLLSLWTQENSIKR